MCEREGGWEGWRETENVCVCVREGEREMGVCEGGRETDRQTDREIKPEFGQV